MSGVIKQWQQNIPWNQSIASATLARSPSMAHFWHTGRPQSPIPRNKAQQTRVIRRVRHGVTNTYARVCIGSAQAYSVISRGALGGGSKSKCVKKW